MEQIDGKSSNQRAEAVPNVWVLPIPHITHVICFYQFAKQLAKHGLAITFFCLDDDLQRIHEFDNEVLLDTSKREGLNIQLHSLGPKPPLDSLKSDVSGSHRHRGIVGSLEASETMLLNFMRTELEGGRKPTCLISDLWFATLREVVKGFGIPAWLLSPYASGYLSAIAYTHNLQSKGILQLPHSRRDKEKENDIISCPGLPLLRIRDLPDFYFKENPIYERACINAASLLKCDVVLLSTFYELECKSIGECEKFLKALAVRHSRKVPVVWSIGPTFEYLSYSNESKVDEGGQIEQHPGIEFLDSQDASSVLLVMFGTLVEHTREQIEEIATGLENSQQPFLCVLNPPSGVPSDGSIFSFLPADCIENTRGRGLFVQGWVPQKKLLAHPATGGFVTHCGQNSVLESMSLGVPLLAWPYTSDQFINCRLYQWKGTMPTPLGKTIGSGPDDGVMVHNQASLSTSAHNTEPRENLRASSHTASKGIQPTTLALGVLVDEAQVALEVCKGPDDFVDRKEVERSVRALFHSEKGAMVRRRAREMQESAKRAVAENGSTWKNVQALVALIRSLAT